MWSGREKFIRSLIMRKLWTLFSRTAACQRPARDGGAGFIWKRFHRGDRYLHWFKYIYLQTRKNKDSLIELKTNLVVFWGFKYQVSFDDSLMIIIRLREDLYKFPDLVISSCFRRICWFFQRWSSSNFWFHHHF